MIWVALLTVTLSNGTIVPLLFTNSADPPVKFLPVIVNVWLPVPSPVLTLVGDIEVIVTDSTPTLLANIFFKVPALASYTRKISLAFAASANSVLPIITELSKCSSLIASSAIFVAFTESFGMADILAAVIALSCIFAVVIVLSDTVESCCTFFVPGFKTNIDWDAAGAAVNVILFRSPDPSCPKV